jgi:hypothetical protein
MRYAALSRQLSLLMRISSSAPLDHTDDSIVHIINVQQGELSPRCYLSC